jgi:hypothetical protein
VIPGLIIPAGGALQPIALFREVRSSASALGTFTFTDVDLGPPDPTRSIVAGVSYFEFDTTVVLSSVQVAGVTLTSRRTASRLVAGGSGSYIYANISNGLVPNGSTGTVTLQFSRGIDAGCSVGIWALYNLQSATPIDTESGSSSGTVTLNFNNQPGDLIVAAATGINSGGSTTWGGISELYDTTLASLNRSGAAITAPSSSLAATVVYSAGAVAAVGAAWR